MSTRTAHRPQPSHGRRGTPAAKATLKRARATAAHARRRRRSRLLWSVGFAAVAALIGAMMWSARSTSDATSRPAPDFTLPTPAAPPCTWPTCAAATWCCTSTRAPAASPACSRWPTSNATPPSSPPPTSPSCRS